MEGTHFLRRVVHRETDIDDLTLQAAIYIKKPP